MGYTVLDPQLPSWAAGHRFTHVGFLKSQFTKNAAFMSDFFGIKSPSMDTASISGSMATIVLPTHLQEGNWHEAGIHSY